MHLLACGRMACDSLSLRRQHNGCMDPGLFSPALREFFWGTPSARCPLRGGPRLQVKGHHSGGGDYSSSLSLPLRSSVPAAQGRSDEQGAVLALPLGCVCWRVASCHNQVLGQVRAMCPTSRWSILLAPAAA